MFKKIVCPVGLEKDDFKAVKTAVTLAETFDSELIILHLDPNFMSRREMTMLRVQVSKIQEEIKKAATEELETIQKRLEELNVLDKVNEIVLREGNPEKDIPQEAEELGGDLIVVHSTGRSTLGEMVTGSTSEHIAAKSDISILILR